MAFKHFAGNFAPGSKAFEESDRNQASLALATGIEDQTMTGLLLKGNIAIAEVSKEEDRISNRISIKSGKITLYWNRKEWFLILLSIVDKNMKFTTICI